MIAMALALQPSLIIADEPTTALDVTIQAQILELIRRVASETGAAVMLITHDLGVVAGMTERIQVMYAGRIVETATTVELFAHPRHPYTVGLLRSIPRLDETEGHELIPIEGLPPDLTRLPGGCSFAPRCAWAIERCLTDDPVLAPVTAGRPGRHGRARTPPTGSPAGTRPRTRRRRAGVPASGRISAVSEAADRRATAAAAALHGDAAVTGAGTAGRRRRPASATAIDAGRATGSSSRSATCGCTSRSPRASSSSATSATSGRSTTSASTSGAARRSGSSASRAAASRRPAGRSSASTSRRPARSPSTGSTSPGSRARRCARCAAGCR